MSNEKRRPPPKSRQQGNRVRVTIHTLTGLLVLILVVALIVFVIRRI